jgi:hypothetical protein
MAVQRSVLRWHGDEVAGRVRAAAIRGLSTAGEYILAESVKVVPLDESPLQDSGAVGDPDPDNLTVEITYDTEYAVRQHEKLAWRHAPGRQAKYLEEPFNANRGTAQKLIAAAIRRATR